jgi:hypothetical protein
MSLYKKPQTPKDQSTSSNLDLSSLRKKLKVVVVGSSREDHDKFIQLWLSSEAKNKPQDKNVLTIGDKEWSIEFENIDKIESLTYGDGYIYIYSCNNKQSFGNISQIHGKLQFHYKSRPFARILVGNVINDEDRQVSTMEGLQKGDEVKCPYLETNQVDTNGIGKLRFYSFSRSCCGRDLQANPKVSETRKNETSYR